MRPGVAERVRDHPLGRRFLRGGRADVGVEIEPGHTAEAEGQILEQSLGNETQLDVPLVSGELAADVGAVNLGLALYRTKTGQFLVLTTREIHVRGRRRRG